MNNWKGFTIVEMMVALVVFSIFAAVAFTFYHVQARQGAGSAKRKLASETVTLAMASIKKDILQAGMGLREQPALSIFVVNGPPDQLYLSCAEYLDMDLSPDASNSFFNSAASPGPGKAWFQLNGSTQMVVNNVSRFIDSKTFNSAITLPPGPPNVPTVASATQLSSVGASGGTNPTTNTQTLQMTLPSGVWAAAPAIYYNLDLTGKNLTTGTSNVYAMGRLLRNGVAMIGIDDPIIELPIIKVTDFRVRCEFSQGAGGYVWSPDNGSFTNLANFLKYAPTPPTPNLRLVEVTFQFIYRDEGGGFATPNDVTTPGYSIPGDSTPGPWMIGGPRTLRVSPRNLVLESYL